MQAQENTWVVLFVHGKSWHFWIFLHDFRNEWYVHVRKGSCFVYLFYAEGLCLFPSQTFVAIEHLCLHFWAHLHPSWSYSATRFPAKTLPRFPIFLELRFPHVFWHAPPCRLTPKASIPAMKIAGQGRWKGRAESHFRKNDILMAPQGTNLLNLWIYFQQRNFFRLSL